MCRGTIQPMFCARTNCNNVTHHENGLSFCGYPKKNTTEGQYKIIQEAMNAVPASSTGSVFLTHYPGHDNQLRECHNQSKMGMLKINGKKGDRYCYSHRH